MESSVVQAGVLRRPPAFRRRLIGSVVALFACALVAFWPSAPRSVDCSAFSDPTVIVESKTHTLALCADRQLTDLYRVRLGFSGMGKTRAGDRKTPSGDRGLAVARRSAEFGAFIPIAYPTEEEAMHRGYTGSNIGIHGPHRNMRWLGSLVNTFDTTDGCIGLATDAEASAVATWVKQHKARRIILR